MERLKIITSQKAPRAVGPYSHAVVANGFIFVSGQIAISPDTGHLVGKNTAEQTRQVLTNLASILESAETELSNIVKTTVYLKNMQDFEAMNQVYAEFFSLTKPARVTVEVARLPKDALVEIDAIAVKK